MASDKQQHQGRLSGPGFLGGLSLPADLRIEPVSQSAGSKRHHHRGSGYHHQEEQPADLSLKRERRDDHHSSRRASVATAPPAAAAFNPANLNLASVAAAVGLPPGMADAATRAMLLLGPAGVLELASRMAAMTPAPPPSSSQRRTHRAPRDRERPHEPKLPPTQISISAVAPPDLAARPEDVIVLSDDDEDGRPRHHRAGDGVDPAPRCVIELKELTAEEVKERELLVRKLKDDLLYEEVKLVMLRKLQQSHQHMKENLEGWKHVKDKQVVRSSVSVTATQPPAPAASVRLAKPSQPVTDIKSRLSSGNIRMSPTAGLNASTSSMLRPRPSTHSQGGAVPSSIHPSISIHPQPLAISVTPGGATITPTTVAASAASQPLTHLTPSTTITPITSSAGGNSDTQSPAQRQAAAKLALRKQLEKTLLQIPPPKPPPPEMHFLPNPNNGEFIYVVGLETVVTYIMDGGHPSEDLPPKPFECVQCGTDFTPVWKWNNPSKGTVMCELCVTSNIKKALKAEHTNRLKAAFVKALQQEQEIEQRMAGACPSPPSVVTPPPSGCNMGFSGSSISLTPSISISSVSGSSGGSGGITITPSSSASNLAKSASVSHQQQAAMAAAINAAHQQLLRFPASHQPLPAHVLTQLNPFLAQAYQYQQMLGKSVSSSELQRQYLLDMIPPRSLPQGSLNWKS